MKNQNKVQIYEENGKIFMRSDNLNRLKIYKTEHFAEILVNEILKKEYC